MFLHLAESPLQPIFRCWSRRHVTELEWRTDCESVGSEKGDGGNGKGGGGDEGREGDEGKGNKGRGGGERGMTILYYCAALLLIVKLLDYININIQYKTDTPNKMAD